MNIRLHLMDHERALLLDALEQLSRTVSARKEAALLLASKIANLPMIAIGVAKCDREWCPNDATTARRQCVEGCEIRHPCTHEIETLHLCVTCAHDGDKCSSWDNPADCGDLQREAATWYSTARAIHEMNPRRGDPFNAVRHQQEAARISRRERIARGLDA